MSILAAGPTPFWYLTRSAGVVAMLLLTASVVLGIVDFSRWRAAGWPRFLTDALHRNVSMLALVMVVVHVITTVADGFAPIGFQDAIIPFITPYRPIWVGLGALSFDLLLAVTVTSLMRKRLGYRAWRAVHWAAYGCWPLAMFHGLGTGTDASSTWMLLLSALCLAAVVTAIGWRVAAATPRGLGRSLAASALGIGPIALIVFSAAGPLGSNWAARAGTPANLLPSTGSTTASTSTARSAGLTAPFNARLSGSLKQQASAGSGLASVEMRMDMSNGASGSLDVTITGQPLEGGGVAMTQGSVSLGPRGEPNLYTGRIVGLQGSRIVAAAQSSDGSAMRLAIDVQIDEANGRVNGTVQAQKGSSA
jgi:sulfoxide reductase heme-binding subunit YedZ